MAMGDVKGQSKMEKKTPSEAVSYGSQMKQYSIADRVRADLPDTTAITAPHGEGIEIHHDEGGDKRDNVRYRVAVRGRNSCRHPVAGSATRIA